MSWLAPIVKEVQELKINQQSQQTQIIALLQEIRSVLLEQNQLLKQLLQK